VVAPTPENVRGWLGAIWPTLQHASPVTVLIILALWTASIWWFTAEIARVHGVNQALWTQVVAAQKAQVDLAWRCYRSEERQEEGR
jgi:hypothetical protein